MKVDHISDNQKRRRTLRLRCTSRHKTSKSVIFHVGVLTADADERAQ
jgi:hypothetical protein